jgi:hypothetical protein
MYCGQCCVMEPRSRAALRLDIFIEILLGTGVKIDSTAVHFYGFGVARQGPWNTWVNKRERKAGYPSSRVPGIA